MPKTKTRETVGKISSELLNKIPDTTDPIALERLCMGNMSIILMGVSAFLVMITLIIFS